MALLTIEFKGVDGVGSMVNHINTEMHSLTETTNVAKESGTGFFSNMLSSAGGFLAANIIGGITSQVSNFVGSIGTVMAAEQDQMAQLQAGLASTGGKAGVTIDMMTQLAEAQAKQTKFSVAQTEAIEKIGLTFTSINKDVFPQTVSLAEDMSARLGIQGSAAMTMLGKAMDDPLKGMAALHRVGVSFTDEQKNQVKALLAAGDTMGAQKIILSELGTEYGGSATAAGKTFSGQQEIINHQMDELKVKIGTAVMPILGQLMGFVSTNLMPVFGRFADWFAVAFPLAVTTVQNAVGKIMSAFGDEGLGGALAQTIGQIAKIIPAFEGLQHYGYAVGDAIDAITGAFGDEGIGGALAATIGQIARVVPAFQGLQQYGYAVGDAIDSVTTAFGDGGLLGASQALMIEFARISPTFALLKAAVDAAIPPIKDIILTTFGIIGGFITEHGAKIKSDLIGAWRQIQDLIKSVTPPIQEIIASVFGAVADFLKANGADIQDTLGSTWDRIANIIKTALELIKAIAVPILNFIASFIQAHGKEIQTLLSSAWSSIKATIDAALTLIEGVIKVALDVIHGNWSQAWEDLKTMSARIVLDLWTIIKNGLDNVVTVFGSTWTKIKDGVGQFVTVTIPGLGQAIIDGLISSISNGSTALGNAVWNMIKNAVSSAIASLGGSSGPSANSATASPRVSGQGVGGASVAQSTNMRANVNIYPHPAQNPHQVAAVAIKQLNRSMTLRRA